MTSSYFAVTVDTSAYLGDTLPNAGVISTGLSPTLGVSRDPRVLPSPWNRHDSRCYHLGRLLDGTYARVVRVSPIGEVRPHRGWENDTVITERTLLEAEEGWRLEQFEPADGLLGPCATYIVAALNRLHELTDRDLGDQYLDELRALSHFDWVHVEQACLDALRHRGFAPFWLRCDALDGQPIHALAARDLIGTVPGWDQDAYDLLSTPYRRFFGQPLHPDDKPVHALAA